MVFVSTKISKDAHGKLTQLVGFKRQHSENIKVRDYVGVLLEEIINEKYNAFVNGMQNRR